MNIPLEQRIGTAVQNRKATADSAALTLSLEFTLLVMRGLRRKGWTVHDLAERTKLPEGWMTEMLICRKSPTCNDVGTIFHALDMRAELVVHAVSVPPPDGEKEKP